MVSKYILPGGAVPKASSSESHIEMSILLVIISM